ncbi:protein-L-isoaspartate(D-aspartate) O-methyltransferase [Aliiruegeria haliotis]|uniref:Protein-L-isoaspartate O-methyltransferase n=1 Tax=Aliiruegeria haliotis TaxID=1280846 RepID=A0A2T0RR18_9RHOB|nr:methyltransferase domain-containing protein [Aliiruegeria haliotis]PRY23582.1 protein-L-isoaspartate(D-aspartate) O-methyltransferase [Aliiruegeria haliotis]
MTSFDTHRTTMVDTQVRPQDVTKYPIIDAMLSVPRELYVPDNCRASAYVGTNIDLGDSRVVLEPRTLAKLLDVLNISADELVLDVACGMGYSTAVVARMAQAVVALEADAALADEAESILAAEGVDNAAVVHGPFDEGAPQHGPYDVMLIQGGVEELPEAYVEQLRDGGRIACLFMENNLGVVRLGIKSDGVINWRFAFNAFAPVIPGFEQKTAFKL